MLACLIGIPIMALRGTPYATMIRQFIIQKLGGSVAETDTRASLEEAPPFAPTVSGIPEPAAPFSSPQTPSSMRAGQQPDYGTPSSRSLSPTNQAYSSAPAFQPSAPVTDQPPTVMAQPGGQPDAVLANYDYSPNAQNAQPSPLVRQPSVGDAASTNRGLPSPGTSLVPPPQAAQTIGEPKTVDQFLYIQQRLRDLGANYYLLENWGNQGECYRFHCRIAVANNPNFAKHFEATDEQPLGAMTQVLADVESWRRGGRSWETLPVSPPTAGQLPERTPVQASSPHGPYVR